MSKISIKAVLLGCLVALGIDIFSGLAFIPLFAENMSEKALNTLGTETGPLLFCLILGALSTFLGGYIAAKAAKTAPYLNSGIVGLAGLAIGILLGSKTPLWFNLVAYASVIPAALLGGYFASIKIFSR